MALGFVVSTIGDGGTMVVVLAGVWVKED